MLKLISLFFIAFVILQGALCVNLKEDKVKKADTKVKTGINESPKEFNFIFNVSSERLPQINKEEKTAVAPLSSIPASSSLNGNAAKQNSLNNPLLNYAKLYGRLPHHLHYGCRQPYCRCGYPHYRYNNRYCCYCQPYCRHRYPYCKCCQFCSPLYKNICISPSEVITSVVRGLVVPKPCLHSPQMTIPFPSACPKVIIKPPVCSPQILTVLN